MLIKFVLTFVLFLQISNGYPTELAQSDNDVKKFDTSRIVGGVEAPEGHSKHMVALVAGTTIKILICGGSIITNRHILSAAHCIEPFVYWGVLWEHYFGVVGSLYWNTTNTIVHFSGFKNHPEWNVRPMKNDIGILYTANPIRFTDKVAPIPIHRGWIGGNEACSAAGWGRVAEWSNVPDRLRLLYLRTISSRDCYSRMAQAAQQWGPTVAFESESEICTFHSVGHGMCNGDSGSALVLERTKEQIGIVSWGYPCAVGAPDIFVRLGKYIDFIVSATGRNI